MRIATFACFIPGKPMSARIGVDPRRRIGNDRKRRFMTGTVGWESTKRLLTVRKVMTRSQLAHASPRRGDGVSDGVTEPALTRRVSGGRGLQTRRVSEGMRRGLQTRRVSEGMKRGLQTRRVSEGMRRSLQTRHGGLVD